MRHAFAADQRMQQVAVQKRVSHEAREHQSARTPAHDRPPAFRPPALLDGTHSGRAGLVNGFAFQSGPPHGVQDRLFIHLTGVKLHGHRSIHEVEIEVADPGQFADRPLERFDFLRAIHPADFVCSLLHGKSASCWPLFGTGNRDISVPSRRE